MLGTGAFGVLTAAVFGARRVVGMGGVFARVLLMDMLIMRVIFACLCGVGGRGCLDGGRVGQSYRRQRLAGVDMAVFVMGMFVMGMIVLVVSMFVIVRMLVMIVMSGIVVMPGIAMMLCIGMMFGVVRMGMAVFAVQILRVALMRLGGL